MNTAYAGAIVCLALALVLGFVGTAAATSGHLHTREAAPWILGSALLLLVAALVFAGVGLGIQY